MSPLYCDFSGKPIEPQCGSQQPALGRDYYTYGNKIISHESREEIEYAMKREMLKKGFGNYSYGDYQELQKSVANKDIRKGVPPRAGRLLG